MLAFSLLALCACSPAKSPPVDTSDRVGSDTADTAGEDSGRGETGDTSDSADSGDPDSGDSSDSGPDDTGPDDTGPDDTGETASPDEDADGDGYAVADGDCDDADPDEHPGAAEVLDGDDDDCDGQVDTVGAGTDADASLVAAAGDLGYRGLSVGDLDADGLPEVVVAAPGLGRTVDAAIHLLEGADYATFTGDPALVAETTITVQAPFGFLGGRQGDVDGDGDDDLVAIGWNGAPAMLVFAGPVAPGALTASDAAVTLDATAGASEGAVLSDADPDGDGACGLIFGDVSAGTVRVWTGAPGASVVAPGDADAAWTGSSGLGRALAAGDLDGDGADDIAVADYVSGLVYVLPAADAGRSGSIASLAAWSFDLETNVGAYGGLAFGDVDAEGGTDLVIGEPFAPAHSRAIEGGRVEVYRGGLASGAYTFLDADLVIEGEGMGTIFDFGHQVGVADPFGDGPVLLASAPVGGSPPSWLFGFDARTATRWSDHRLAIEGGAPGDGAGHRFLVDDLDLDGRAEWVVAAPAHYSASSGGTLWFFAGR